MYEIEFTSIYLIDIAKLKKSEPVSYKKLFKQLEELKEHPHTGTGHPEPVNGTSVPTCSGRISNKLCLVYEIENKKDKGVCSFGLLAL